MAGRVLLRAFHRLSAVGTRTWQPVMAPVVSQVGECHRRQSQPSQCLLFRGYSAAAEQFDLINIQDSTHFQRDVLENATPVVVDFHATWCGPCKLLAPRLESIIGGKSGKVVLAKVDVDENPELAMKYGVKSVPTVLGVRKGEVLDQFIGCKEDDELETFVEKLIN